MGGVIFGFCVILVCILGEQNAVKANPVPASYDMCTYLVSHEHRRSHKHTTTPAPAEDNTKDKEEGKDKNELFRNFLKDLLELEKETDNKKKEAEKKKEEEEQKKKEDQKQESKGFQSMDDFWESYIKFFTALYYSI